MTATAFALDHKFLLSLSDYFFILQLLQEASESAKFHSKYRNQRFVTYSKVTDIIRTIHLRNTIRVEHPNV